jgi:hypothetical protein
VASRGDVSVTNHDVIANTLDSYNTNSVLVDIGEASVTTSCNTWLLSPSERLVKSFADLFVDTGCNFLNDELMETGNSQSEIILGMWLTGRRICLTRLQCLAGFTAGISEATAKFQSSPKFHSATK